MSDRAIKRMFVLLGIVLEKEGKIRINPYNPLTYLTILLLIPVAIWNDGYGEAKDSLKTLFRKKK